MKKIIEFQDEEIEINVNLNIDHSETNGVLHNITLRIPSYGDNKLYGSISCNTSNILSVIEKLIDKGKNIIAFRVNEDDLVKLLKEKGFEE